MNTPDNFDDERCRREWELQERALREKRQRADAASDARVAQYRFIARALRHPPLDPLPNNFAAQTTARIESLVAAADERFEIWLQRGLVAFLALGGITATLVFGSDWLSALTLPAQRSIEYGSTTIGSWSPVIAACLGLSWGIEHWHRHPRL